MEFWETTLRFFSLTDANVRYVVAGSMILGGAAGGLGTFAYLQRRSLLGDALAHAALPGVALAFMVIQQKILLGLLLGAAITGWIGAQLVNVIVRNTKIKLDAALGIVLTVLFGFGIVLLTHIQRTGAGAQSGLDKFLFGQAAAIGRSDVVLLGVVGAGLLLVLGIGYRRFKIIAFDSSFASALGMKVGWLQFLLTTMIVVGVTIGLQAVGVVLMAALLITPAAAARQWTEKLSSMIIISSLFGMLSGLLGAWVSFLAPRFPTGPWVVIVVSAIFMFSLLFAPRRGVISHVRRYFQQRRKMNREHILKVLFKSGQESHDWARYRRRDEIQRMWTFAPRELRLGLGRLQRGGYVERDGDGYRLSEGGTTEGARVTRLHRLWELYLTRYLDLPGDHVHRDAEEMEHIITPEMERRLDEMLEYPEYDPHRQEIPRPDKESQT